jgi:hypothetical protein
MSNSTAETRRHGDLGVERHLGSSASNSISSEVSPPQLADLAAQSSPRLRVSAVKNLLSVPSVLSVVSALCLLLWLAAAAHAQDPFADAVVSFTPGTGAGFGADELPGIVLGPPRGGGELQQSLDVVSLGNGGVITLRFDLPVICDGPGADLSVFENAFHVSTIDGPIFEEYGIVAVSQDGVHFLEFPYDPITHAGLAGRTPVLSSPDNGIDPLDPSVSGGDQFDLADLGLAWAAYVRITDPGDAIPDPGNRIPPGDKGGFDLDALAALHACDPNAGASATPTFTPTPTVAGETSPTPTADVSTPTTTSPTPTTTATAPTVRAGDLDGNGRVDAADLRWLIAELYDGDGDDAAAAGGGAIASGPAADVNGDGRITAADLVALPARWSP